MLRRWLMLLVLLMLVGCGAQSSAQSSALPSKLERPTFVSAPSPSPSTPQASTIVPATLTVAPAPTPVPSPTPEPIVQLAAVGDVMLARSIGERIISNGAAEPLAAVASTLQGADVTIANLECAIGTGGEPAPKAYRFLAPPAAIDTLLSGGVDVVSLANNHSLDWGVPALSETLSLLDAANIAHAGAGMNDAQAHTPVIIERNGLRLALLSYVDVPIEIGGFDTRIWTAGSDTPGLAWAEPQRIAADVAATRQATDHVIVLLHSGYEGVATPNDGQRAAAYAAVDAGATLVIGAHPHVLQGVERRGNGLIAYSLGNFVFDGFAGTPSVDSAILHVTLDRHGVREYGWAPVRIIDGYPVPLDANGDGAAIVQRVQELSAALNP